VEGLLGGERKDMETITDHQLARAAQAASLWWGERLDPQWQDRKAQFIDEVRTRVCLALRVAEKDGSLAAGHAVGLDCDYDPHGLLLEAVQACGIPCEGFLFSAQGILPTKHYLRVFPDRLEPKEGYGNWTTHIPISEED
jgi:hypothetical protein